MSENYINKLYPNKIIPKAIDIYHFHLPTAWRWSWFLLPLLGIAGFHKPYHTV